MTGVQTCALPICFPVTISGAVSGGAAGNPVLGSRGGAGRGGDLLEGPKVYFSCDPVAGGERGPMASSATKLFCRHEKEHRLNEPESEEVCQLPQYIRSVEESMSLDNQSMPMVIISASGMATGGRIVHHLKHFAPHHKNTIVFCGFQAGGTRGDRLVQ